VKARFLEVNFEVKSKGIIIGQRIKGGVFRPVIDHIPSSTVEGMFRNILNINVKGFGIFNEYEIREFTYSVRDKMLNFSKMPITTQYIKTNGGKIYILKEDQKTELIENLVGKTMYLGGLKSKGFGKIKIVGVNEVDEGKLISIQGKLVANIYLEYVDPFEIKVISPIYGYLIKGTGFLGNGLYRNLKYIKSLMKNSIVKAPKILIEEETYYDE